LGASLTVNSTIGLTLTNGRLYLANFNLAYATTATSTGGTLNSANMVVADASLGTGQVMKNFNAGASAAFTFPVGDNGPNYVPASLTFSANATAGTAGVQVNHSTEANMNNPSAPGAWLSRFWTFTNSGLTTYTYTGTFAYANADINGLETDLRVSAWQGSS